ncbi:sel1 repeat family protein [Pseudochrobactrum sp. MP213Fo]|uniref:sel1 repeat family protein n=1 Tax=Pseudochrobactrum sp. MP213Fo TaxID=3022250 RepID=UPI003BA1CD0B
MFTSFSMHKAANIASMEAEMLFETGMMYYAGRDCVADRIEAYKWFNIAAIRGDERALPMRSKLSALMSKSELVRALREAREWMARH